MQKQIDTEKSLFQSSDFSLLHISVSTEQLYVPTCGISGQYARS